MPTIRSFFTPIRRISRSALIFILAAHIRPVVSGAVLRTLTAAAGLLAASAGVAGAQTTVTLHEPEQPRVAVSVPGGTYASTNLRTILETRSSTYPEYTRRALLKFDTQNTIPAGSSITSAILTITGVLGIQLEATSAPEMTETVVGNAGGTRVSFDVTPLGAAGRSRLAGLVALHANCPD